ncbi:MAG: hypothetical protein ACOYNY_25540 [Caldilineaceae bacterium]|jgi:hypothetical protein
MATVISTADENGKLLLQIPNLVIRRLYAERWREVLLPSARTRDAGKAAAEAFYQRGELQPLCDFIEQKQSTNHPSHPTQKEIDLCS